MMTVILLLLLVKKILHTIQHNIIHNMGGYTTSNLNDLTKFVYSSSTNGARMFACS